MKNISSEEVTFTIREKFSSFFELKDGFRESEFRATVYQAFKTIKAAVKRAIRTPKKQLNHSSLFSMVELKYSEIECSCIHGGKVFRSTSMGDRSTKVAKLNIMNLPAL